MGLERTTEKLDKYFDRLENGKAAKIKPSHVEKVIAKLKAKQEQLQDELASSEKLSKQDRLENKLAIVAAQLERAHWLLAKIGS